MKYIINTKGEVIFQAENAGNFEDGLCPVQVNGKCGFINTTGLVVIPCVYETVGQFKNECAIVKQGGKYGLINKYGNLLIPCEKSNGDDVPLPHEGVICINIGTSEKKVFKCVDTNGNHLFTKAALVPFEFSEGVATIWSKYDKGTGLINKSGEYIIPEGIYNHISEFHYGVAEVSSETTGKRGFINHQGEVVVPIKFDYFSGDPFPVMGAILSGKYGYIDVRTGKEIVPIQFDLKGGRCPDIRYLSTDDMVVIHIEDEVYIYNIKTYRLFKSSRYKEIYRYSEGLCCVRDKVSEKIGFINTEGKLVIPCIFNKPSYTYEFHGNICAMGNDVIDKQGNILRKIPKGNKIRHKYGKYHIEYGGDYPPYENLLDENGNIIYSGVEINTYGDFPIAVRRNSDGKWGFIDKCGKLVIPYQFNESYSFYDGFAILDEPITKVLHNSNKGCYIATAIYGSYDCPEVWTLRRYRDNVLDHTWYGRLFIRIYYSISPTLVRWFGTTHWFRELFYKPLNNWVAKLNKKGFKNTPYRDKD